jgi:hypothetical protein
LLLFEGQAFPVQQNAPSRFAVRGAMCGFLPALVSWRKTTAPKEGKRLFFTVPTALDSLAQGNALGIKKKHTAALKGRDTERFGQFRR